MSKARPACAQLPARRRVLILGALVLFCAAAHAIVLSVAASRAPAEPVGRTAALDVRWVKPVPATSPPAPPPLQVEPPAKKTSVRAIIPAVAAPTLPPAADQELPDSIHLPTSALDTPPMPRSAPDAAEVDGVEHSGAPIRLRLFIDSDGSVSTVEVLWALNADELAANRLAAMFRATSFIPGRSQGRDVASYMDVEVLSLPSGPSPGLQ